MNARDRRHAHYRGCLTAPTSRDMAVAQAVDEHLTDLGSGHQLRWDNDTHEWVWEQAIGDNWAEAHRYRDLDEFARAQALDIPAATEPHTTSAATAVDHPVKEMDRE